MAETLTHHPEEEPQLPVENESKFRMTHPWDFEEQLPNASHIEQVYLSSPTEDWGLRVRETVQPSGEKDWEATLKSRAGTQTRALIRSEINTPISEEAYRFYAGQDLPRLEKLRATLCKGVTVDWLVEASKLPQPLAVEIEWSGQEQLDFYSLAQMHGWLGEDVSHDPAYDNEHIAHERWGKEQPRPEILDTVRQTAIKTEILQLAEATDRPIVVGVKGRSGSGKSTLVAQLKNTLELAHDMPVAIVSTDDYHRGKRWLLKAYGVENWNNWDAPVVYNTGELAFELTEYLSRAEPILKRHFDFSSEEPVIESDSHPLARVLFVEGLYPHAPELDGLIDYMIDIPTPIATCIGRRVLRDMKSRLNDSFGSAADVLRYQLETAEPTYQRNNSVTM